MVMLEHGLHESNEQGYIYPKSLNRVVTVLTWDEWQTWQALMILAMQWVLRVQDGI